MNEFDQLYREVILDHYKNPRGHGVIEDAVPARVLVVVEDDLAIHLLELVHANTLRTVCRPSTSWSISSRSVYR